MQMHELQLKIIFAIYTSTVIRKAQKLTLPWMYGCFRFKWIVIVVPTLASPHWVCSSSMTLGRQVNSTMQWLLRVAIWGFYIWVQGGWVMFWICRFSKALCRMTSAALYTLSLTLPTGIYPTVPWILSIHIWQCANNDMMILTDMPVTFAHIWLC